MHIWIWMKRKLGRSWLALHQVDPRLPLIGIQKGNVGACKCHPMLGYNWKTNQRNCNWYFTYESHWESLYNIEYHIKQWEYNGHQVRKTRCTCWGMNYLFLIHSTEMTRTKATSNIDHLHPRFPIWCWQAARHPAAVQQGNCVRSWGNQSPEVILPSSLLLCTRRGRVHLRDRGHPLQTLTTEISTSMKPKKGHLRRDNDRMIGNWLRGIKATVLT